MAQQTSTAHASDRADTLIDKCLKPETHPSHKPPKIPQPLEHLGTLSITPAYINHFMGVRFMGTLGDGDPLNTVPVNRAISKVQKGPL